MGKKHPAGNILPNNVSGIRQAAVEWACNELGTHPAILYGNNCYEKNIDY